jgi:DNA-binding NarL/FixJ family response regulator
MKVPYSIESSTVRIHMPIRVLLADLPQVVHNAVHYALSQQLDMIVTSVSNNMEILLAAGETQADVVVLVMKNARLPGIATHLLQEYPNLKILAVSADGRNAFFCELRPQLAPIDMISWDTLPDVIRAAVRSELA